MLYRQSPSSPSPRTGAATLEFAVVAPLLFMLVLGIVEFGRYMMVHEILTNGAREAERQAVLPGATQSDVDKVIKDYLDANLIAGYTVQATDPAAVSAGSPITVTVSVPYARVSWLPAEVVQWSGGRSLAATVVMRKEKKSN